MTTIFAQMGGDAITTCRNCELGSTNRIGVTPAARVANGCDVIDINAKTKTIHALAVYSFRLRYHWLGA